MKCSKVKKQLALYVGNDLPEDKKAPLLKHLKGCPGCLAEFEELKRSQELLSTIAANDRPDPLPSDFQNTVMTEIDEGKQDILAVPERSSFPFRLKPTLVIGAVIIGIFLSTSIVLKMLPPRKISLEQLLVEIEQTSYKGSSELEWDSGHIMPIAFEGPYNLSTWESPDQAGVFVVMHKPDPENKPNTYSLDFCGQGRKLSSYRGYTWINHRKKILISRTGSLDNVYIAFILMPGSSKQERRKIEKAMIETFVPYFNTGV
jgi:hypothetical protein